MILPLLQQTYRRVEQPSKFHRDEKQKLIAPTLLMPLPLLPNPSQSYHYYCCLYYLYSITRRTDGWSSLENSSATKSSSSQIGSRVSAPCRAEGCQD
jgi:hypothetical protein